jgi:uncharacterized NAD(P)/FAD-binding protein YdhS
LSHIAIVGGGFSGVLQAIQLLRQTQASVTLVERAGRLARGVAYSTRHGEHLLNVRASGMSAFPEAPDHFVRWLRERGGEATAFAERRLYGRYLEDLLAGAKEAGTGRLKTVAGEVVDIVRGNGGELVRLADGSAIAADAVILSLGNLEPEVPRGIDPAELAGIYVSDPWAGDIAAGLGEGDTVLLIGTGLTAIDAALILDAADFRGRIVAISRRGLVPRPHAEPAAPPALERSFEPRCAPLIRSVREQAERIGWRAAVDQLRPLTQALWSSAPTMERRRFLRHLRPYWDVHRHRIAPEIAARIAGMERDGRLRFAAGRLLSATPAGVTWRPRASREPQQLPVVRIVNCTGPQSDIARAGDTLLDNLLRSGRIRADGCRIGIDVDPANRAVDAGGSACASLFAIGPMTRGARWEIVAVPDIRVQVAGLAAQLAR